MVRILSKHQTMKPKHGMPTSTSNLEAFVKSQSRLPSTSEMISGAAASRGCCVSVGVGWIHNGGLGHHDG